MRSMSLPLILFCSLTFCAGLLVTWLFPPDTWHQIIRKPVSALPFWVVAASWSAFDVLMGVVGWRTFLVTSHLELRALWAAQVLLRLFWPPIHFGAHMLGGALAIMLTLLMVVLTFILIARRIDPLSARMLWPYAFWIGATSLFIGLLLRMN